MDVENLSILNPNPRFFPGPALLHQLVSCPSSDPALDHLSGALRTCYTYQQLHIAADRLAQRISQAVKGHEGNLIIPVLIEQSPLLYIALLGILKVGGAFCPLNIDAPAERITFILEDVSAPVVVVSERLSDRIPEDTGVAKIVSCTQEEQEAQDVDEYRIPAADDLAYVMYTSGSTGTPKGVAISHSAVTQALLAHDQNIPSFRRFLQFASPTFDVSVFEIFFPLYRGATLVSCERGQLLDDLPLVLRLLDVDACELTPTVAGSLLRKRQNAPQLKLLLTIGEMLSAPVIHEFGGSSDNTSMLWAMYGPTEATIHCTLQTRMDSSSTVGNIGIPLDTVSCFVARQKVTPEASPFTVLPRGEIGELVIGGYQLASGYVNRPEQTAEVFIDTAYGRLYRTGDKARLNEAGMLECLGRLADGQIKLRGQRLELGEVEQAILRTPGCHGAAAMVIDSNLIAFCDVDDGISEVTISDICRDWLPLYMVPNGFSLLNGFPRLPSGKADKKKLRADYLESLKTAQDHGEVNSQDAKAREIMRIVSQVLETEVTMSTHFTAAGLDSLKSILLAAALRNNGFDVSTSSLLSFRKVLDLYRSVRSTSEFNSADAIPDSSLLSELDPIAASFPPLASRSSSVQDILPCTPVQTAMLARTAQAPDAYCNEIELSIPSRFGSDQIGSAFRALAQHNESLRTGFVPWRNGFASIVFDELPEELLEIVMSFDHSFGLKDPERWLQPLRIQCRWNGAGGQTHVLLHLHHALYDGWSMDAMRADLSAILNDGNIPRRPQFRGVHNFFAAYIQRPKIQANVFWEEHLRDWNKAPFPKLQGRWGASSSVESVIGVVPRPLELGKVTQDTGCSPTVFYQAAVALVWSQIIGHSDVVIGTVTSGRSIPIEGMESVMGPCIASLPLRINLSTMSTGMHLLHHIKSSNQGFMEHCSLPLFEIRRLVHLHAGESMYDVLFTYQESPASGPGNGHMVEEVRHQDRLETKVLVEVEPRQDSFAIQITFHSDVMSKDFASELVSQIHGTMINLVSAADRSLQEILRMDTAARPSIFNATPQPFQGIPDLGRLFALQAQKTPDREAIRFVNDLSTIQPSGITFRDLDRLGNKVARLLCENGTKTGDVVAILMAKSISLYAGILGIVKAGCAYLPLLPSTPLTRVQEIFNQAAVKLSLVDEVSLQTFGSIPAKHVLLHLDAVEGYSPEPLPLRVDGSRLAYVIYTSGTTGKPKGVAVTQKNIVSNITHLNSVYPITSSQPRLLQACSQAFDVSVFEIFFTWLAGMCLCAGPHEVVFTDIEETVRRLEITHLSLTPTVAGLIDPRNVPTVEFLVTAGEPMTQPVLDKWGELLWQGYGPSETTNICSVKRMRDGENIEHLGWTFPNTSTFVLYPNSTEVVATGRTGEFCFGGDQVAQGYLNALKLTAAKFINHPLYGRLYRSGDMGRMLPDGSLVILGRIDDQIKLRGQRIEPGEINSIITQKDNVLAAETILVTHESQRMEQLVSFYVHEGDEPHIRANRELSSSLFASLRSRLPAYAVPSYLVPVSTIPKTPSGKVDRQKLGNIFKQLPRSSLEAMTIDFSNHEDEEWSNLETTVADIVTDVTNVTKTEIGRWTPFVTLGLDSITSMSLAREIRQRLQREVSVSAILCNPNVAQLSRYLDSHSSASTQKSQFFDQKFQQDTRESFSEQTGDVSAILPCTPLQEAMLARGRGSYYNKLLFRLRIDQDTMRRHWQEMNKRHEVLRTCFISTDDANRPMAQIVLRDWQIPWLSFAVKQPSLDAAIHEHLMSLPEPVDSRIPPLSLAIIKYKDTSFLSFICHHALYDGVAMEILWREIESLSKGSSLASPVSYEPFLREALDTPEDSELFWKDQFADFRATRLLHQNHSAQTHHATNTLSVGVPLDHLQQRLRSLGFTLLSACQASWATLLSICLNSDDVCFGNVMSGRTTRTPGVDRLVAPCFNTVPVRQRTAECPRNIDLLRAHRELGAKLLRYQFTPLRRVQKVANQTKRTLFDTLLLLQQPLQEMDDSVWLLEEDSGSMDIPLVCEVVPCPSLNSIVINIHHDMSIVSGDLATMVAELYREIFKTMIYSPFEERTSRGILSEAMVTELSELRIFRDTQVSGSLDHLNEETWTELEDTIRRVLSTLAACPVSKVRRDTTIFQIGLDSINAVQVASILRQQDLQISASDVMECPTCAKLATRVLSNKEKRTSNLGEYNFDAFEQAVLPDIKEGLSDAEIEAIHPCTPVQSAMMASFIQSNGNNYLNAMTYQVESTVGLEDLVRAWKLLYQREPVLRTGFIEVRHKDATFAMVRNMPTELPLTVVDEGICLALEKSSLAQTILSNPGMPPWWLFLNQVSKKMTIMIHHALYDAHSWNLILDKLAHILRGSALAAPLSFESGLSTMLGAGNYKADAEAFWVSQADKVVVNKFPIMTPLRETVGRSYSDSVLSSMSFSALQCASQAAGVSIQAVLQATWTRLLSSYLGEQSVVFGITLSNRSTEALENVPLPSITTVPIVASNQPSNEALLASMMDYNSHLQRFQSTPLAQVQKCLGHPASSVFDTLLVYQRRPDRTKSWPWNLVDDSATVEYPISFEVEPLEHDQLHLSINFSTDILPKAQASLILQQFDAIMQQLVSNPTGHEDQLHETKPSLFSVLPAEKDEVTAPVKFVHQFVEQRAVTDPEKIALEFVDSIQGYHVRKRMWSYRELDAAGNRIAHLLLTTTSPGDLVAIHFDKCPEAYFSILGILKAGCSFVALDPSAPKTRKEFILRDSQAPCLLTNHAGANEITVASNTIVVREEALKDYPSGPVDLRAELSPLNTCYCLYTSGTTGTPKGCEITHENTVQAIMAFQHLFRGHWETESRWLQFASLHFDVSVLEQYWSWSVGITVVAAPKDLILDDLTGSIHKMEITHIDLTPSLARLTHPDKVPSLCKGVFITGGEQLRQEILDVWGSAGVIYNAYGPTEATIGVTTYSRVPRNGRPSNIGRQFINVGSYVLKPGTDIPVLRGAVGELVVAGKLVGKGYLHREDLTKQRFPTLQGFGERVYRTGDLVRLLEDGCFDFLGRADDQVKLRGQRLEIGEIDHVIRSKVPSIHGTATMVLSRKQGLGDVLVAFLAGTQTTDNLYTVEDVDRLCAQARDACRDQLPGYMVPTYFLRLTRIPLSSNNKADVGRLKTLFNSLSREDLAYWTNSSSSSSASILDGKAAEDLRGVLSEFSGVQTNQIQGTTSIFDIGVDSVNVLRLSSMLKRRGFDAPPALLLKNPNASDIIVALGKELQLPPSQVPEARQLIQGCSLRYRTLACRVLGTNTEDIEYIAPCSPLQEGIVSKALTSDSGAYFNFFEMRLGGTNFELLKHAWADVISAEPILRSSFINTKSQSIQVALKAQSSELWHSAHCRDKSIDEFVSAFKDNWIEINKPHVITPLRFLYLEDHARLFVFAFHAIYDGISFDLLLQRVATAYSGQTTEVGPSLIEALAHGPLWNYDYCKPFWERHLRDWSPMPAPNGTFNNSTRSATRHLPLTRLEVIRKTNNVTLQSVLLALWSSVLQFKGVNHTIGVLIAGRSLDLPNVDKTIGPLFNTLPFFSKGERHTWASLIRECHDFTTTTMSFQHVPLKKIQRWCSNSQPLFNNLFSFRVSQTNGLNPPWDIIDGPANADYPLALEIVQNSGELVLNLLAKGGMGDTEWLEEILTALESNIEAMGADDGNKHISLPHLEAQGAVSDELPASQSEQPPGFTWDSMAIALRTELETFAGLASETVSETTTMNELGIDSIDIVKFSARLRDIGIDIPASEIVRRQTISEMMQLLEDDEPLSTKDLDNDLQRVQDRLLEHLHGSTGDTDDFEAVLPSTSLQESMVASMVDSGFEYYFNHDILEVQKDVDLTKLRHAWLKVVENSPILRTGFYEVAIHGLDMAYCQVVHKLWNFIREVEFDPEFDPEYSWDRITKEAINQAKQYAGRNGLFQLVFVKVGARQIIVLSIAHALYDGWSLGLIYQDLRAAYEGEVQERPPIDLLFHQSSSLRSARAEKFWVELLQGAQAALLPQYKHNIDGATESRVERASKTKATTAGEFASRQSISLQTLCQACWAAVLARRIRSLDVTFGVILSGRDFEDSERLCFPTMNTVAMRYVLHGSCNEFLGYIEETTADVREFQGYPLRKALLAAGVPGAELFNSLFIFHKSQKDEGAKDLIKSIEGVSSIDYPVCVEVEAVGNELMWRVANQPGFFSEADCGNLFDELDQVMEYMTTQGNSSVIRFGNGVSICGLPSVMLRDEEDIFNKDYHEDQSISGEPYETIVRVLSQLSGAPVDSILPNSTLYHLGLDSIAAIRVASKLREEGVYIRTRDLVQAKGLSQIVLAARRGNQDLKPSDIKGFEVPSSLSLGSVLGDAGIANEDVERILPALPMQVYMVSIWRRSHGKVFFPKFLYRINGSGQKGIREAWGKLVEKTPILRTCFVHTDSEELPLLQVILSISGCQRAQKLVKFGVREEEEGSCVIELQLHHALYDGFSLPSIINKLAGVLDGKADNEDIQEWSRYTTIPGSPSYRDARRSFWTSYLEGCETLYAFGSQECDMTDRVAFLSEAAVRDVNSTTKYCLKFGVSVQSLFLAAFAKTMVGTHGKSGKGNVVFGIYLANRDPEDRLPSTYPTLALVPLKVNVTAGSLSDMAASIQDDLHRINSEGRERVGVWEIVQWTGVKLNAFVNFLSLPAQDSSMGNVTIIPIAQGVTQSPENDNYGDENGRSLSEMSERRDLSEIYSPTVDVEASIVGSRLDIGIFGPRHLLPGDRAASLAAEIATNLTRDAQA